MEAINLQGLRCAQYTHTHTVPCKLHAQLTHAQTHIARRHIRIGAFLFCGGLISVRAQLLLVLFIVHYNCCISFNSWWSSQWLEIKFSPKRTKALRQQCALQNHTNFRWLLWIVERCMIYGICSFYRIQIEIHCMRSIGMVSARAAANNEFPKNEWFLCFGLLVCGTKGKFSDNLLFTSLPCMYECPKALAKNQLKSYRVVLWISHACDCFNWDLRCNNNSPPDWLTEIHQYHVHNTTHAPDSDSIICIFYILHIILFELRNSDENETKIVWANQKHWSTLPQICWHEHDYFS